KWEDEGFLRVANGDLVRATVSKLRRRKAKTKLTWVKGHNGCAGNEAVDHLANDGGEKPTADNISGKRDTAFMLSGAKLSSMTQSIAYRLIKRRKMEAPAYKAMLNRKATKRNMILAQQAVADPSDDLPSVGKIWKSTKHKDISRSARFFLWMLIHDGYKVGRYWDKIVGHKQKATCNRCGISESMAHILTQCDLPGQEAVWELASEVWKLKTGDDLPKPTTGQIMSCAAIKRHDAGTTRLYRILVSESAHLIWRLRCEQVIQEKPPASGHEIHNRWLSQINNRLGLDRAMTNDHKYGKKAIKKSLVLKTWCKVLKNEDKLPKDWTWETEVLVGIG
ncbi:hypothetical protein B0H17DRAFT_923448, partial [Mycena rosella]